MPHMHPSGWVSGVFYLKIPSKIKGDEAGIQFHLDGDDFIRKDTIGKLYKKAIKLNADVIGYNFTKILKKR